MNTYLYRVLADYILINTVYKHSLKNVEGKLRKQDIPLTEIRYIFLTHTHDDHAGYLNELLSKYSRQKQITFPLF